MVGGSSVGKTSLVARFVKGIFSDKYLTSIGVKIDKKTIDIRGTTVELLLWDLNGEDRFQQLSMSYLRGAAGYLLVVDGTRRTTVEKAMSLRLRVIEAAGDVPFILLINKKDLHVDWEIQEEDYDNIHNQGWVLLETSAKSGIGVEDAFFRLASMIYHT